MPDLQEAAVVTEDVREQASSLGYELRREVTQIIGQDGRLWPASDDSPIPGKRCHIVSRRGPSRGSGSDHMTPRRKPKLKVLLKFCTCTHAQKS